MRRLYVCHQHFLYSMSSSADFIHNMVLVSLSEKTLLPYVNQLHTRIKTLRLCARKDVKWSHWYVSKGSLLHPRWRINCVLKAVRPLNA